VSDIGSNFGCGTAIGWSMVVIRACFCGFGYAGPLENSSDYEKEVVPSSAGPRFQHAGESAELESTRLIAVAFDKASIETVQSKLCSGPPVFTFAAAWPPESKRFAFVTTLGDVVTRKAALSYYAVSVDAVAASGWIQNCTLFRSCTVRCRILISCAAVQCRSCGNHT